MSCAADILPTIDRKSSTVKQGAGVGKHWTETAVGVVVSCSGPSMGNGGGLQTANVL